MRKSNTKRNGKDFFKEEELAVWNKVRSTNNPNVRLDTCDCKIQHDKYGDTSSMYGGKLTI